MIRDANYNTGAMPWQEQWTLLEGWAATFSVQARTCPCAWPRFEVRQ